MEDCCSSLTLFATEVWTAWTQRTPVWSPLPQTECTRGACPNLSWPVHIHGYLPTMPTLSKGTLMIDKGDQGDHRRLPGGHLLALHTLLDKVLYLCHYSGPVEPISDLHHVLNHQMASERMGMGQVRDHLGVWNHQEVTWLAPTLVNLQCRGGQEGRGCTGKGSGKPGKSHPISRRTGRSGMSPTCRGHSWWPSSSITLTAETWRTSPWMQVMSRCSRGTRPTGRMVGQTKVTVLLESRTVCWDEEHWHQGQTLDLGLAGLVGQSQFSGSWGLLPIWFGEHGLVQRPQGMKCGPASLQNLSWLYSMGPKGL